MSIRTGVTPANGAGRGCPQTVGTQADKPVFAAPLPPRYKRILVPIDFSECSINALEYAVGFAEQYQATLLLFHVIEPGMAGAAGVLARGTGDMHERVLEKAREDLDELCRRRLPGRVHSQTLVRIGRPPSEIADTAKALGADLIIMGTHGERGHKPSVMGTTAERVVRQASCPVLTVRFPGAPGARKPLR